jgi:hypothetical protein
MTRNSEARSLPPGWSNWIRQSHRWIAIAFTLTVAGNFAALGVGEPPFWVYLTPLLPLGLLMLTGLYLFVLPYIARWRGGRAGGQE